MTTHPEISHLATEERIRAIAYSIWEEEGRPDGRAETHWLRACELVEAEATPQALPTAETVEPDWLKREPAAEPLPEMPKPTTLEQLAKRISSAKAA